LLALSRSTVLFVLVSSLCCGPSIVAQTTAASQQANETTADMKQLTETIAVTGYEDHLGQEIREGPQVMRLQSLAERHKIPMQYGVTGGGNDGSAFLRYGAVDVPLSWPLRYSHSPGELINTRDLDALSAITADLAREW